MKSFLIQPFEQRIHVTDDPAEFTRRVNQYSPKDEQMLPGELDKHPGMAIFQEHPTKGALFILYISRNCEDWVIYHEALHMVHFVMAFVNAPINLDSTETQAYMLTHIADLAKKKLR